MMTDGWAVAAGIVGLIGVIFTGLGILLTLGIITAFVGIPFIVIGVLFLLFSSPIFYSRKQKAQQVVNVLRHGEVTRGEIVRIERNYHVRMNSQYPWVIHYRFRMNGQDYGGEVRSYTEPGAELQPGQEAAVLYLPNAPEQNAIYPHP